MLGLDPEGPLPLDMLATFGYTVENALYFWQTHGQPTAVSGDPHFKRDI